MRKLILLAIVLLFAGCTDAEWDRTFNYGARNRVEMYSGGKLIKTYHTTGKIQSENGSDGYYFRAEETNGLVTVSGDVIITEMTPKIKEVEKE